MRLKMKELEAAKWWFQNQDRLNVERLATAQQSVAVLDRDITHLQMLVSGNLMGLDNRAGSSATSSPSFSVAAPVYLTS